MTDLSGLKVKIFADGADLDGIRTMAANPLIKGFTTNPTLMRKAGVEDYKGFALDVLKIVTDRPVSFEVFADEFESVGQTGEVLKCHGAGTSGTCDWHHRHE